MAELFGAFTRALRDADLEKYEEYLHRHPGRQRQGIVPDLQIGTALYELKGVRSDRSHSNYNVAQVTGVEKRGVKIPMEIQKQAVDLDEKVQGVWGGCTGGGAVAAAAQRAGRGEAAGLRPVRGTRARI
jgi:hypothetical protein